MEKVYISDLEPNQRVESAFLARNRSLQSFRNKPGHYLSVTLADKTGEIQAKAWDNAEQLAQRFKPGDVVLIRGRADEYQGTPQIIIDRLRKCTEDEIDPADYIAATTRDVGELLEVIRELVETVREPHLRQLLDSFLGDEQFVSTFSQAPAAKRLHHNYIGGLIEHVSEVMRICDRVCEVHPQLDRDLLLTAAMLHDIGKMSELRYDTDIDYTDEGRLIGHVLMGDRMVQDAIDAVEGFPRELATLLRHVILSHHGHREWGAPIEPMMAEAVALHYADIMDAKIRQVSDVARQTADEGRAWSAWQPMLERYVYAGNLTEEISTEE